MYGIVFNFSDQEFEIVQQSNFATFERKHNSNKNHMTSLNTNSIYLFVIAEKIYSDKYEAIIEMLIARVKTLKDFLFPFEGKF